jgi:hypothetical protein
VNNINSLLTNGAALLTLSFVNETSTLIGDVSPLLDKIVGIDLEGLLDAVAPLLTKGSV